MYIVLYSFEVKDNNQDKFIEGWKGLTRMIYEFEGSLGSRLHRKSKSSYVAYAQWPNKTIFENSGKNLPNEANAYRNTMRDACNKIEVIDTYEVIEDLLKTKVSE